MNLNVKFLRNFLMLSDYNLEKMDEFLPKLKELMNISGDAFVAEFYSKLCRKMNCKFNIIKDKFSIFTNKYSDLLNELVRKNILMDLILISSSNYDYKLFKKLCDKILSNLDSKEEMIKNINYFIRFGADNIEFVESLNETHSVFETSYFVSTFYTDGEIEWNGKGQICENYNTRPDLFKIRNANYVLSFVKDKNTNQNSEISVIFNNLVFNNPLPTYDILNLAPYGSLMEKEKVESESKSIDIINMLIDCEKRIVVLEKEITMTLNKVQSSVENVNLEVLSDKIKLLSEVKETLNNLNNELVIYYDDNDVISKDKMKRLVMFDEKA